MYQNGEHMLIMLCHLAYVMPQLPFKRLWPRLLTNAWTNLCKYLLMILVYLVKNK
jgi:hypothetical protein